MKQAIYPGTFDPITIGHMDVIQRARGIFDQLVIAVVAHSRKNTMFGIDQRLAMVRESVAAIEHVVVEPFDGLLVDYARARRVHILIRGIRAYSDFEYEFQMALTNRKLAPDIETIYLMPNESFSYISSSIVREVFAIGGDTSGFVPKVVQKYLERARKAGASSGPVRQRGMP
jgi:pantetheine-phosphate adenylyltransferase